MIEAALPLQQEFAINIAQKAAAGLEPWLSYRNIGLLERNHRDHAWLLANQAALLG